MTEDYDEEATKNGVTLRNVIDQICNSKNVFHGLGPPMRHFRTPPDASGAVKTFVYVQFGNDGVFEEAAPMRGAPTFGDALSSSTKAFEAWLQPRRTLAWRVRPEVEKNSDGLWRVYWRCVQLDDGARSLPIEWVF